MRKIIVWSESVAAFGALTLAATAGLKYLSEYGHHHYACWGPLLPCMINSKADLPAGIAAVWLSLAALGGLAVLALLHMRQSRRLWLWLLLLVATVYWLGFVLVEAGIFVIPYALSAVCVLVTGAAAIARQVDDKALPLRPALLIVIGSALLWFVTSLASAGLADPIGLGPGIATGPPGAQDSLLFAVPTGRDPSGAFIGLDQFTDGTLNRIHQGADLRPLRFVSADTPSTGADVVSVNPIGRFTWSAVALSSDGTCYAILSVHDSTNPSYGSTYFGRLPKGSPCVASAATPSTVTGAQWPMS